MPRKTTKTTKVTKATKKPTKKPVKRPTVQQPVPVAPQAPPARPTVSEADRIWAEIRFRPIEMFGLPNQIVEQHVTPFQADPNKLFLTARSTAVLPSLEVALGKEFGVELADKFLIITRSVVPVSPPKR